MEEITSENVPVVNDDLELDKILEDSINTVKAGNELSLAKESDKVDGGTGETPVLPKSEDASNPPATGEAPKEGEYDYRIPNKGKFESDESFEKRIELMDLVKKRKLAKTDEQRQLLSEEIKTTKGQLKNLNGSDKLINPLNSKSEAEPEGVVEDETLKADKERLKQLGGATREDIQEILKQERQAVEVKSTLEKFVERHSELKDEDTREVFFDFVDSNFNWEGKSGRDLMTVLELARESMFKPSESIQERVLKGANVQEKVNAMQFPGGTITKTDYSPDVRKSIDELVATGLSEEKALELISE